jgi:hypothetical protein
MQVTGVLLVSLALVWFVRAGVDKNALADGLYLFYIPTMFVVLSMFGGVHAAPEGSDIWVFIISFTVQNLAVWYAVRGGLALFRRAARET